MLEFIKKINLFFWGGPMMILLLGTHLYFTLRLRFVQRYVLRGIRKSASNLTVLTTTLAATLGTGNIIGIGTAIYFGGPGAVLWCWLTGLLGMATTYAESYLSLFYRDSKTGVGGPMILLSKVCHKPALAILYAGCICLSAFCIGGMTQVSAISMAGATLFQLPPLVTGLIVAFLAGLVLFLGASAIETFCQKLVPAMGFFFLGGCLLLLLLNHNLIWPALSAIFKSAFTFQSFGGGILGYSVLHAVRYGISRGLYTNEAGLGTAGIIASGTVKDSGNTPEDGALVSMCATFFDTVILCAITGIAITVFLIKYPHSLLSFTSGELTGAAFDTLPFLGNEILNISLIAFALATLIGWSYIGHQAAYFIAKEKGVLGYKLIYLFFILFGATASFEFVWELTDLINLCLAFPCLYALLTLRKQVR